MRISSVIRAVEDMSIGAGSKIAKASRQLTRELSIEARARHMANVELKAAKQQMLADCREAIEATDRLHAARQAKPRIKVPASEV